MHEVHGSETGEGGIERTFTHPHAHHPPLHYPILFIPWGYPDNPLKMDEAWKWLARLLNLTPRRITATLLITFLEVTGDALLKTYGRQARKLFLFILQGYIPMLPKESVAHTTRLKTWLETWRRTGKVDVSSSKFPSR